MYGDRLLVLIEVGDHGRLIPWTKEARDDEEAIITCRHPVVSRIFGDRVSLGEGVFPSATPVGECKLLGRDDDASSAMILRGDLKLLPGDGIIAGG